MAKTKKFESRRRMKEEEALHGVKRTPAAVGKSKSDQRRALLAAKAAAAVEHRAPAAGVRARSSRGLFVHRFMSVSSRSPTR